VRAWLIGIAATLLILSTTTVGAAASNVSVTGVRVWPAPDHTRIVLDITGPVKYSLFSLPKPDRLVIDLDRSRVDDLIHWKPPQNARLIRGIRSAVRNGNDLRVVVDLKKSVRPKTFLLKPNRAYGHRLVVDLYDATAKTAAAGRPARSVKSTSKTRLRDVVIAIDAGHGGEDPGASGFSGTFEKDVVLGVARELNTLVRKEYGMRPVMIRKGDYYISLRGRMAKARRAKADLLVSIHADAFKDGRAKGASVYILSQHGASSEAARWLAEDENKSDFVGGVSLDDKDDLLASVLLDLSQTATIETSYSIASSILKSLGHVGRLHKRSVEQAGFVVLKSPDVPSVLVETAYISNPREERQLRDRRHRRQVAAAILAGIRSYFSSNPPMGTYLANRKQHVIARGETLSEIAEKYSISVGSLRLTNGLSSDTLHVGQVLRIPAGS